MLRKRILRDKKKDLKNLTSQRASKNHRISSSVQTWILRRDLPLFAVEIFFVWFEVDGTDDVIEDVLETSDVDNSLGFFEFSKKFAVDKLESFAETIDSSMDDEMTFWDTWLDFLRLNIRLDLRRKFEYLLAGGDSCTILFSVVECKLFTLSMGDNTSFVTIDSLNDINVLRCNSASLLSSRNFCSNNSSLRSSLTKQDGN